MNYPFKKKNIFETDNNFIKYANVKSILKFDDCQILHPQISVVIPTYNSNFLKEAVESAINQITDVDYEVLIVDNKTDGNWCDNVRYFKGLRSNKIRYYLNEKNIGMTGNWNRCIELAKAEYVVYLHSDDVLTLNCLNELWLCKKQINRQNVGIMGRNIKIDSKGNRLCNNNKELKYNSHYYQIKGYCRFKLDFDTGCGNLLNKGVLISIGGWDENMMPAPDFAGLLLYSEVAPLYRYNTLTKMVRIAINESFNYGYSSFYACNYFMRKQITKKYYGNCFLFNLLAYILATPKGNPNVTSNTIVRFIKDVVIYIEGLIYKFSTNS